MKWFWYPITCFVLGIFAAVAAGINFNHGNLLFAWSMIACVAIAFVLFMYSIVRYVL